MNYIHMRDMDLNNKRVLIRVDLNIPMGKEVGQNNARLRAILPTIQWSIDKNARIILLSHLGRPKEGHYIADLSLQPIAEYLSKILNYPVRFIKNWLEGVDVAPKEVVLCENVRFNIGEKENDPKLAKRIAALCDVFVMDAFATAHRCEASTVGVAKYAPIAVAGPLLSTELEALSLVMRLPKRPLVAIVGGAKVSDKLQILKSLLEKVDTLIVGGGIANTFIAALGYSVGSSLFEPTLLPIARELLQTAIERKINLVTPIDAIVANELSDKAVTRITDLTDIKNDEKIFDVGPKTIESIIDIIKNAGTILWNGPLGVFELNAFSAATKSLAKAIAGSRAFSVAGGGETLFAIDKYAVHDKISYVSTGGGAFLEYLEDKTLPAVAILEERAKK